MTGVQAEWAARPKVRLCVPNRFDRIRAQLADMMSHYWYKAAEQYRQERDEARGQEQAARRWAGKVGKELAEAWRQNDTLDHRLHVAETTALEYRRRLDAAEDRAIDAREEAGRQREAYKQLDGCYAAACKGFGALKIEVDQLRGQLAHTKEKLQAAEAREQAAKSLVHNEELAKAKKAHEKAQSRCVVERAARLYLESRLSSCQWRLLDKDREVARLNEELACLKTGLQKGAEAEVERLREAIREHRRGTHNSMYGVFYSPSTVNEALWGVIDG